MTATPERRSTFGPVLLTGLAGGVLAAVSGAKAWAEVSSSRQVDVSTSTLLIGSAEMPLAPALALVVLACWGVVLVTRGRFRRAVMMLAALAADGLLVTTIVGAVTVPDSLAAAIREQLHTDASTRLTGWFWAALVGAVVTLAATVAGALTMKGWPEMGTRYDAPDGASSAAEPEGNLDVWKALDEGRDPTSTNEP